MLFVLLSLCLNIIFVNLVESQTPIPIGINSSVIGTTRDSNLKVFSGFTNKDGASIEVGQGGQALHILAIEESDIAWQVKLSTCEGSNFDTYLVLLDRNPWNNTESKILAEGANDISCGSGIKKAFLSTRLRGGTYYVVVTGNGVEEGTYNLTITATPEGSVRSSWGLDRIDQRKLPLNNEFNVKDSGQGTWIYLIDSGVRISHEEFEGRAIGGYDFVNNRDDFHMDCTGHGTHLAGIIAGKSYGVAKKAKIVSLRVFGCNNEAKTASILHALDWALYDWTQTGANALMVLSFSTKTPSSLLKSLMNSVTRRGIPVVVPANDDGGSVCDGYPALLEQVMTVGSTDIRDKRSSFSGKGNCTDIYAPGNDIVSSWHTSDTSNRVMSGTAQAAGFLAGVFSHMLVLNEGLLKAQEAYNVIESIGTLDVVKGANASESTRFAYLRSVPRFSGTAPPKNKVLLLFILRANLSSCLGNNENSLKGLRSSLSQAIKVAERSVISKCTGDKGEDATAQSKIIEISMEVEERRSAVDFTQLEKVLREDQAEIEEKSGVRFMVTEMPWAVDSRKIVFWGAPSFAESESTSLSIGAISGIVVGLVCIVSIVTAVTCVWYRRMKNLDEAKSMEGSMDLERGPVVFEDFSDGGSSTVVRSFRNIMRGMSMKSGSARGASGFYGGMNRMGSFIGKDGKIGKDMVRLESFGGEAFAGTGFGLDSDKDEKVGRSQSDKRLQSNREGTASFRGIDNLVLKNEKYRDKDEEEEDGESMRINSLGGEAFAMMGGVSRAKSGGREENGESGSRLNGTSKVVRTEGYEEGYEHEEMEENALVDEEVEEEARKLGTK